MRASMSFPVSRYGVLLRRTQHGECEAEAAPPPGRRGEVDGAAVGARDRLHDGQPETGALPVVGAAGGPVEAPEDLLVLSVRDPRSGVADGDGHVAGVARERDLDVATRAGEAHGVVHQVEQRLDDQLPAAPDLGGRELAVGELDRPLLREWRQLLYQLADDLPHIHPVGEEDALASLLVEA